MHKTDNITLFALTLFALMHSSVLPLGIQNGTLTACNGRHNCAITQRVAEQKPNSKPIAYAGSKQEAQALLKKIIASFARTKIISQTSDYLHVTFESKLWKFIDDVEFYFPEDKAVIHMRSTSRVGKYDLGVNKRRLKRIRRLFQKWAA